MIYLDYAATSFVKPDSVYRAAARALRRNSANPGRGGHRAAMKAAEAVYSARETIGELFGCAPQNVVFTKNATEALNIAIKGLAPAEGKIFISALEHNSVYRAAKALENDRLSVEIIAPDLKSCEATAERFIAAMDNCSGGKLAVVTAASNVCGYLMPAAAIGAYCNKNDVPFIVDASAAAGLFDMRLSSVNADVVCFPGHKALYGPQGSGGLVTNGKYVFRTVMEGGSGGLSVSSKMPERLPERLEYGTLNVAAIAGLEAGVKFVARRRERLLAKELELTEAVRRELERIGYRVHGHVVGRSAPIIAFSDELTDSETLARQFDGLGFALRAGLHCAPLAHRFLGTEQRGAVRFSVGFATIERQAEKFLNAAAKLYRGRR